MSVRGMTDVRKIVGSGFNILTIIMYRKRPLFQRFKVFLELYGVIVLIIGE